MAVEPDWLRRYLTTMLHEPDRDKNQMAKALLGLLNLSESGFLGRIPDTDGVVRKTIVRYFYDNEDFT